MWRPIPLLARSLSPRRYRVFMFSVDDPLDFVRLGRRDSKHAYRSSSCSRPCGPITLEPSEYHIHPPASESQKNGPMNDTSHALLSPRCEQLLARLFVAQIRENDVSSLRKLPDQIKVLTEERPHRLRISWPTFHNSFGLGLENVST